MYQHIKLATVVGICFFLNACSTSKDVPVQYYQPAYRALPPDTVYSRVMWSHLPQPIRPRSSNAAPYFMPTVAFELPDATFEEAN